MYPPFVCFMSFKYRHTHSQPYMECRHWFKCCLKIKIKKLKNGETKFSEAWSLILGLVFNLCVLFYFCICIYLCIYYIYYRLSAKVYNPMVSRRKKENQNVRKNEQRKNLLWHWLSMETAQSIRKRLQASYSVTNKTMRSENMLL